MRKSTITTKLLETITFHRWLIILISLVALSFACESADKPSVSVHDASTSALQELASPTSNNNGAANTIDEPDLAPTIGPDLTINKPKNIPEELKIIWETWEILHQDYVDQSQLDPDAFSEEAIKGMLQVLGDPQTSYISPEVLKSSFGDNLRGDFEGIGAHVQMNAAGKVIIVSPLEGSPAEKAGIRTGDIVLAVDGESIEGLSLLESVSKIRGPKGTTVTLLIKHLGDLDPVEIKIQRGVIPLVSVRLRSKPGANFAHIRISNFYPNTPDTFQEIFSEVADAGAKGLILDVRDNGGGLLDATVDLVSQFLEDGLVLYVEDGKGNRNEWQVRQGGIAKDIPMVVLANESSASASEILVGALQDHNRAKVIGTTTFGKGSVNILRPLSNEGGLYVTIAHWYTPLGRLIQNNGLKPDIEVLNRDRKEADIKQLQKAIEELERMTGIEASTTLRQ